MLLRMSQRLHFWTKFCNMLTLIISWVHLCASKSWVPKYLLTNPLRFKTRTSLSLLSHVGRRIRDGEHEVWRSRSFAWSDWDIVVLNIIVHGHKFPVFECDIFTYYVSILIYSILRLWVMWNLFMCSLDHCSMNYNWFIFHLASCVAEVCLDLFSWWVHWLYSLFSTSLLLWTWSLFIWSWSKREKEVLIQCFGYGPCLLHHGVRLPCKHDFQLDGFYPCFEMSYFDGPHFFVVEHV
jgi:hypothetical protein